MKYRKCIVRMQQDYLPPPPHCGGVDGLREVVGRPYHWGQGASNVQRAPIYCISVYYVVIPLHNMFAYYIYDISWFAKSCLSIAKVSALEAFFQLFRKKAAKK